MELNLNVFQTREIEAVAQIIEILGKDKVTCTLPERKRGHTYEFRVWAGNPDQIRTVLNKPSVSFGQVDEGENKENGIIMLVQIDGENFDRILEECQPFVKGRKMTTFKKSQTLIWH